MKTRLKIILPASIISIALVGVAIAAFALPRSLAPEQEERISYDKDQQVALIDSQLAGIDLEKVRAKKDLIMEKPIEDLHAAISKGDLTYEELTAFYLDRIKTYDAGEKGINAVAAINPKAIEEARTLDASSATPAGMRGIPVLVKDNVNTNTMPTSGGTYALKDFTPKDDADVVTALTNSGAIILGKSNLSELANFMDTKMPSGYSSKAGQTHNPFDPLNLSPEGSSSGSGAAVAANFSAAAIGTETTGSIIAPAAIHSIVGFKPTKDAISTAGVMPLSSTMDTVGTMAKSVKDAAVLYNASVSDASKAVSEQLDAGFLRGKRIGIVGDDPQQALARKIEACGAQAVPVELSEDGIDNEYIINQDFKNDLDRYLQTYQAPVKSLSDLIAFNQKDPSRRAKYGQDLLEDANEVTEFDKAKVEAMVKTAQSRIDDLLRDEKLDALVFYDNEGVLVPATAGYPELTVPAGVSDEGAPRGATFVAGRKEDEKLLNIAYSFEKKTAARAIPENYLN